MFQKFVCTVYFLRSVELTCRDLTQHLYQSISSSAMLILPQCSCTQSREAHCWGGCAAAIWVVLCCPLGAMGRAAQNHSRQMSSEVTLPYQLWCSQPWAAERVRCSQAQREKAIQRSTSRWGWYKSDTYTSFPTWLCAPQFCYTLQTGPLLCFEKSVVTSQGRLV